jgi:hypothetical protein
MLWELAFTVLEQLESKLTSNITRSSALAKAIACKKKISQSWLSLVNFQSSKDVPASPSSTTKKRVSSKYLLGEG